VSKYLVMALVLALGTMVLSSCDCTVYTIHFTDEMKPVNADGVELAGPDKLHVKEGNAVRMVNDSDEEAVVTFSGPELFGTTSFVLPAGESVTLVVIEGAQGSQPYQYGGVTATASTELLGIATPEVVVDP